MLFWIFIISAISYGAYYAYINWWNGDGKYLEGKVEGISTQVIEDASKEFVGSVTDSAGKVASSYIKNIAAGALSSIGDKLHSFSSSIVGEAPQSGKSDVKKDDTRPSSGGSIGVSGQSPSLGQGTFPLKDVSGGTFFIPPPFAAIVLKKDFPLSFSINRAGVYYSVDWGDGERSEGLVPSNNFQIIEHVWKKNGDYTMKMDIRDEGQQLYFYSFPVRIYE